MEITDHVLLYLKPLCCCWLIRPIQNGAKNLKNDWNPGIWVLIWVLSESYPMNTNTTGLRPGGGGGGALSGTQGGRTLVTYFAEEGVFFWRPPHVRDFVKEGYFFVPRYEVWGSKSPYNPQNTAALTPSDSRGIWASEFAAPTCCR